MLKLSKRLETVASLIPEQSVLADVGTDHGYIPIWLAGQGKISRAIAMDIRSGPLSRAKEHIAAYGMDGRIETRLSDGVAALAPGEADTVLIAGMGGGLVIHILESGEAVCHAAEHIVLQPQSEIAKVRAYLFWKGYVTEAEKMVEEDGKYYPMMRVHYEKGAERAILGEEETPDTWLKQETDTARKLGFYYGGMLLKERNPVLADYLRQEAGVLQAIREELSGQADSKRISARNRLLLEQEARNVQALRRIEGESVYE